MSKSVFRHRRVAIDFDGTLFADEGSIDLTYSEQRRLRALPGAAEATGWLRENGFEILIFTCRPDYHRRYLEGELRAAGIAFDYILFYTKPRVDLYIDDKGFRFIDWQQTRHWIANQLSIQADLPVGQEPRHPLEDALRREKLRWLPLHWNDVLDIGCGSGRTWQHADHRPSRIDGVEPDPALRAEAAANGHFRRLFADTASLDLEAYDGITLLGVLEHVSDDLAFLESLADAKAIYLTVPNGDSFHRHFGVELGILEYLEQLGDHDRAVGHQRYYTFASLRTILQDFIDRQDGRFSLSLYGTTSFKFASNEQMLPFLDKFADLTAAAERCGLCGPGKAHGAELVALLEKIR